MAESSNYTRSAVGGSEEDYNRSAWGGFDVVYSRSVLGGSDEDGEPEKDHSRSIISGSDEVMETPCEPCQNEGNISTAVKYCTDCSEYQCGPCSKHHIKFKAFRHHVIKDVEAVKPEINDDIMKMIDKSSVRLAKLDIHSEQVQQRPGQVISLGAVRHVTANLVSTIDVSTNNDKMSPTIWGQTVVQTHYCVVTDNDKKSVKVVDTRTRRVTSQIQLSDAGCVWSITSVNDDQVAVAVNLKNVRKFLFFTTKDVSKIMFFSVSASGIISDTYKYIDVDSPYLGITHSNDRFYATTLRQIDVISMDDNTITTFISESFSMLCGIALSNDHKTLYVCSRYNHRVFSIDLNGHMTASYEDNDLKYPSGITVDTNGYVYVCSNISSCVHQLTADLNKVQVIIKDVSVWSCVFNKNDNTLYLGHENKIKVYNLSYH